MKPWQKGYGIEYLKGIAAVYADHDKGYALGSFSRMSETMIATALDRGELLVLDGPDGLPMAAAEVVHTTQNRAVNDWAGVRAYMPAGSVLVRRPAYRDADARLALWGAVVNVSSQPWVEIWQECPTCRDFAARLGADYVTTKIKASSDLVGVYAPDTAPRTEHDPVEWVGLGRLDVPTVDVAALCAQVTAAGLTWADHYSSYNAKHSWSAVALRGYGGDPDFIIKPVEMSRKWRTDHPAEMGWTVADTPLRARLPAVEPILAAIPGNTQRVRLMRLAPGGGELTRHADITDPEAGCADGCVMRLHIPLVTNPDVRFWSWYPTGELATETMGLGETWYLDTRKPHRAVNAGTGDRIHLVVDTIATAAVRDAVMVPAAVWEVMP